MTRMLFASAPLFLLMALEVASPSPSHAAMYPVRTGSAGGTNGAIAGNTSFVAIGKGNKLQIRGANPPFAPVGQIALPENIADIQIDGQFVYASSPAYLSVVLAANPAVPVLYSQLHLTDTTIKGFSVQACGGAAPAVCPYIGLRVPYEFRGYTINSAHAFEYLGTASLVPTAKRGGLVTPYNGSLVFAQYSHDILSINISNPAAPVVVARHDTASTVDGFATDGDLLFAVEEFPNVVESYSVGQNSTITRLGNVVTDTSFLKLYLAPVQSGSPNIRPLIVSQYSGFQVINAFNPSSMSFIGSANTSFHNVTNIAGSGSRVFASIRDRGAVFYNIANPTNPTVVSEIPAPSVRDTVIVGHYLIAACSGMGYRVFDLNGSAADLPEVGSLTTQKAPLELLPLDANTILGAGSPGLEIVNVSNPLSPTVTGFYANGAANGMAMLDATHVLLASGKFDSNIEIIDISNRAAPVRMSFLDPPWICYDAAVSGTHAYVASDRDGILVLDVSNYSVPLILATVTPPNFGATAFPAAVGISVEGNLLAVADSENGVHFYDITNPASLSYLGAITGFANKVVLHNGRAYVGGEIGMTVYDVSDPAAAVQVAFLGTGPSFPAGRVRFDGGRMCYSAGEAGAVLFGFSNFDVNAIVALLLTGEGGSIGLDASGDTVIDAADIVSAMNVTP